MVKLRARSTAPFPPSKKYRASSFAERAAKLQHAAQMLEKDREHLALIITSEMGKLLRGSIDGN